MHVESLDIDAKGIAHRPDGKTVFIEGALPGESVQMRVQRSKNNWEAGVVTQVARESSQRVAPGCPHFGLHTGACGGCKMQHLQAGAQVAVKQRVLEDNLWHLGKVRPATVLRPTEGPAWGYRHRARLSVRHVRKKGEVLIGFHERKSRYVADMQVCPVLPPHVSEMLLPLRALIASLDAIETCPQIELACGAPVATAGADDVPIAVTALVLRHLEPLSEADLARLRAFTALQDLREDARCAARPPGAPAVCHQVRWWLQPKGPDTARPLDPDTSELAYTLPEFGVTMPFSPTDFTQVNPDINRVLVTRALQLLDVKPHESVIDWFCGLGNFTLPLATRAAHVLGIEGSAALVRRAAENFERNRAGAQMQRALAACKFIANDLFELTAQDLLDLGRADKWLIDPPREGAFALVKALAERCRLQDSPAGWHAPQRIVYVSCNPATLARDAGLLVHQAGYACVAAGVVNMFPHTAHVESIALFERIDQVVSSDAASAQLVT